jgi:hypothetical protein
MDNSNDIERTQTKDHNRASQRYKDHTARRSESRLPGQTDPDRWKLSSPAGGGGKVCLLLFVDDATNAAVATRFMNRENDYALSKKLNGKLVPFPDL